MGIFGSPQTPYAPPIPAAPPPPPTPVDKGAEDAAARTKAQLAAAGGYGGTMATSGQGVGGTASVQMKSLLGQ